MPSTTNAAANARRILLLNLALAFYNAAILWLLQLDVYPSWRFVPTADFGNAENEYFRSVVFAVFPFAAASTAIAVFLILRRPRSLPVRAVQAGVVLQALFWLATAFVFGPWESALDEAPMPFTSPAREMGPANHALYHLLVLGNWSRVAFVVGYAILAWWLAVHALVRAAPRSRVAA